MTIQELRDTLREHAADVRDDAVAHRADQARRRARATRRRQALVAVAAAVVVVPVVVTVFGGNPWDRTAPVVDDPGPDPAVLDAFAGRTLLDSRVVRGGSEATLSYVTEVPTQWTATCFGASADFTMRVTLDGGSPGEAPCEPTEPADPQMGYVLDDRFAPGPHTVHLWLTSTDGEGVVPATAAVLAAGVYLLPDPVAVVAGVPVYELERVFDPSLDVLRDWEYVESRESEPGDQRLVAAHQADGRMVAQLLAPLASPDEVTLLLDGVKADASAVLGGSGFVGPLPSGTHTVELRVRAGADEQTQVGILWRESAS